MARKLTIDEIYEKEFHVDFKGYNAVEVDQFLDEVLEDYQYFESVIEEQRKRIEQYEDALKQQKRLLLEYEGRRRAETSDENSSFNHVDILKRVSRLEEAVFKKTFE